MNRVTKSIITAAAVVGATVGGVTVAGAATDATSEAVETDATAEVNEASEGAAEGYEAETDDDMPITGDALDKATAAALAETGGGEVIETEIEDEEVPYEVEVLLEDGTVMEVELDSDFQVVSVEEDDIDDEDDDMDADKDDEMDEDDDEMDEDDEMQDDE